MSTTKRILTTWLVAACLLLVGYPLPTAGVQVVAYLGLAAASVIALVAATLARDLRPLPPLLLLAAGLLAFLVGDSLWVYHDTVLGIDPFPSKADVWYLSGYPLLTLALWANAAPALAGPGPRSPCPTARLNGGQPTRTAVGPSIASTGPTHVCDDRD